MYNSIVNYYVLVITIICKRFRTGCNMFHGQRRCRTVCVGLNKHLGICHRKKATMQSLVASPRLWRWVTMLRLRLVGVSLISMTAAGCVLCEGPQGGVRLNLNRYTVSVASVTYTASSNPRPRLLIVCRCPRGLDDRLTAVQLVGRPRFHRALRHQRITENNNRQRRHCTLRCKLWQALEFSQFHLEDSC